MDRLVPLPAVLRRFGISRPTAYRWIAWGLLPKPRKNGPGRTAPLYWREADLVALEAKVGGLLKRVRPSQLVALIAGGRKGVRARTRRRLNTGG